MTNKEKQQVAVEGGQNLNDILSDMSDFISLQDGQSFEGKFVKAQRAESFFNPEKDTIALTFEVNGKEKSSSGVRLARELTKAGIKEGDNVRVTRVATKGTKVEWKVEKI